jgi:prepilin-type N-terminal cleavage/methylation domain-containing protein
MRRTSDITREPRGFSLAEVLAALTIGAMVLVAVLGIYSRAENSVEAITRELDSTQLPLEVLQRIAEDLDGIFVSDSDTTVTFESKFEKRGYSTARLEILKTIYDSGNKKQTFERIVWQTSFDDDLGALVLYRSHNGIVLEDKLLDEQRRDWEKEFSFVPICTGVTFFKIQVPRGDDFLDKWTSTSLPPGIVVTISFVEPFKALDGTMEVLDEEKTTRTIAIDRTRRIKFRIVRAETEKDEKDKKAEGDEEAEEMKEEDVNELPPFEYME